MTYKENSNVFLNNNRRYLDTWANEIYVATEDDGVYYTDDFLDPSIQPIWTSINAGLASTECRQLQLDPFNQRERQYVLINITGGQALYRRENRGNWVEILNNTEASAMTESSTATLAYFCVDETVEGRLWVDVSLQSPGGQHAFYSDDYGNSWVSRHIWTHTNYGCGAIRACGNSVYLTASLGAGGTGICWFSNNKGTSWDGVVVDGYNAVGSVALNPLTPHKAYVGGDYEGGGTLYEVYDYDAKVFLQSGLVSYRSDIMWFHPTEVDTQRIIWNGRLYSTQDSWYSLNTATDVNPNPYMIAPWASNDSDKMFVGTQVGGSYRHKIATLTGIYDATPTGIAGTNCGTPPYTDSIPYTGGGIATDGIQAVKLSANDNTYGMRYFVCGD